MDTNLQSLGAKEGKWETGWMHVAVTSRTKRRVNSNQAVSKNGSECQGRIPLVYHYTTGSECQGRIREIKVQIPTRPLSDLGPITICQPNFSGRIVGRIMGEGVDDVCCSKLAVGRAI